MNDYDDFQAYTAAIVDTINKFFDSMMGPTATPEAAARAERLMSARDDMVS